MAVRVRLTVTAAPGGVHTASEPVGMTLQGDTVSVLLAGINGTSVADDVSNWHTGAPPPKFVKRVVLKVQELAAAKASSCDDLARFAFARSFGVDAAPYKVYGRLRCAVASLMPGGAASRNGQEARPLGARTRIECLSRGRRSDAAKRCIN